MVGKRAPDPVDGRIAALAARQHGVVGRGQLIALGLSRQAVDKRVSAGRLHRIHRGVYAVGHARLTRYGRFVAALLALGPGAVLSHVSAAGLWRLPCPDDTRTHLTVAGRGGRRARRGIAVHRANLELSEMRRVKGFPVTSPARTVIDMADSLSPRRLERMLDEAAFLRLDMSGLAPRHGRPGCGRLSKVMMRHRPGTTRTRTGLEEQFLALCRREGLPQPQVNALIEGYEADFSWRQHRLVVETDGRAAHGTAAAFERDRIRDAELTAAGWRVVRVSYRRLTTEPTGVGALMRSLLAE